MDTYRQPKGDSREFSYYKSPRKRSQPNTSAWQPVGMSDIPCKRTPSTLYSAVKAASGLKAFVPASNTSISPCVASDSVCSSSVSLCRAKPTYLSKYRFKSITTERKPGLLRSEPSCTHTTGRT